MDPHPGGRAKIGELCNPAGVEILFPVSFPGLLRTPGYRLQRLRRWETRPSARLQTWNWNLRTPALAWTIRIV